MYKLIKYPNKKCINVEYAATSNCYKNNKGQKKLRELHRISNESKKCNAAIIKITFMIL